MTLAHAGGLHCFLTDFMRRSLADRADCVDASGVTDVSVIDQTPYGDTLNLDASSWSPSRRSRGLARAQDRRHRDDHSLD